MSSLPEKKTKIIVAVINDLATDQRVHRTCSWLHDNGYKVLLVGRRLKDSMPLDRPYQTMRFRFLFNRGFLFYATYNLKLFLFLLFSRTDHIWSNDLDTLPACYFVAKIRRKQVIYDSHEYFTGVPELQNRPRVRKIWEWLEKKIFPHLKLIFTVNDSIAALYENQYGKRPLVLRNVPFKYKSTRLKTKSEIGVPETTRIVILQGSGINVRRGAEEAVEAMKYVENAVLLIIGSGDVIFKLHQLVDESEELQKKIIFFPKMAYAEMMEYTGMADIGLSLDKPDNINYLYSLPNKLFDYIQSGIAVLASNLPEVSKIVEQYQVGETIDDLEPITLGTKINKMLNEEIQLQQYKQNSLTASEVLCWENEQKILNTTLGR